MVNLPNLKGKFLTFKTRKLRNSSFKQLVKSKESLIFNGRESGQALLLILLIMSVALTVVLSTVSRSVTDIAITSYEEDSSRAFSAAEAGIEEALLTQANVMSTTQTDGSVYEANKVSGVSPGAVYEFDEELSSGEVATFWFVKRKPDGQFDCSGVDDCTRGNVNKIQKICWGSALDAAEYTGAGGAHPSPAIELAVVWDSSRQAVANLNDYSNVQVTKLAIDPIVPGRDSNGFLEKSSGGGDCIFDGVTYAFSTGNIQINEPSGGKHGLGIDCLINDDGCLIMAKVRLVYNSEPDNVVIDMQGETLPPQGTTIESAGKSGDSIRKVSVFQGNSLPPSMFDSAIFSNSGITK